MELEKKFKQKKETYLAAVNDFEATMAIDTSDMAPQIVDAIENGQIQKFEIVTELLWKTLKHYLLSNHAVETKSPKQTIKEFFLTQSVTDDEYNLLLDMLDDRNRLSHIYQKALFEEIKGKLPKYLSISKIIHTLL
ncbi:MAG: hypothetical protein GY866_04635 [Proteobacteria bacterium]|nr:hypothetical protein [Pseudomonadota bacterium]